MIDEKITRGTLADFTYSCSSDGIDGEKALRERYVVGDLCFLAPELLLEKVDSLQALDIWSLGCILYALTVSKEAFISYNREPFDFLPQIFEITGVPVNGLLASYSKYQQKQEYLLAKLKSSLIMKDR